MHPSCYVLVDAHAFFVSCERIFRPDLKNKPVLVLSNNDGCVISRSDEVKKLGVKMAQPAHEIAHLIKRYGIHAFSSNYSLYGDCSRRLMNLLASMNPEIEVYSIDEAFLDCSKIYQPVEELARDIKRAAKQQLSLPVGIGIAPTKTLAKLANHAAKKYKKTEGIVYLMDPERQRRLMEITPVNDLWGIGRQTAKTLKLYGIHTALQLRNSDAAILQRQCSVMLSRTIQELRGIPCDDLIAEAPKKQQILSSRSFGTVVTNIADMKEAIATYVEIATNKLRNEALIAKQLTVFIATNRFNKDTLYSNEASIQLTHATDDTRTLTKAALEGLERIWKEGKRYIKGGVILRDLYEDTHIQGDLFSPGQTPESIELMKTIDTINHRFGHVIRLGTVGTKQNWAMRRNNLSPAYTTRWDQLVEIQ